MLKIVLDTNVLVSALLSPFGSPAQVLDMVLNRSLQLCFDARMLTEYEAVLHRPKFGFDARDVSTLLGFLTTTGVSVTPTPANVSMKDEGDRAFYEVAKYCGARLITGNLKHFPNDGIAISPSDFLKLPML